MDKDAFISKSMVEDKWKLEFDCDPKLISHLEKLPFDMESLFTYDSNDDKISFSWDNNAEAWPATEVTLLSGKGTNKRPRSTPKRAKKCSKKQKQAHTAQKGVHALIGGFTADELDEEASVLKCMLGDKLKLEFNYYPKFISQLEKFPFEMESVFNDDSNNDWWTRIPTLDDLLLLDM
jgi:hypothetical protein